MTLHGVPILADARSMIVQRVAKGMRNHGMSCVAFVNLRLSSEIPGAPLLHHTGKARLFL